MPAETDPQHWNNAMTDLTGQIWITGARGFIGSHLARRLNQSGAIVSGIGHGQAPAATLDRLGLSHWLNGGIEPSNLDVLAAACGGPPDSIFHLAGGSSVGAAIAAPREDFDRTVAATANLLEWMRTRAPDARLVVVSSAAVYGAGHTGPISEDQAIRPYSPYGFHKLAMEQLCHSYGQSFGLKICIARLFSVYGPGLRKQLLWDVCCRLAQGETPLELGGSGSELRDWTAIDDVVSLLAAVATQAATQVPAVNLATGIGTPVRSVVEQVISAYETPAELTFSGRSRAGDPHSLVADTSRMTSLGLACTTTLERGIQDYVRWFKQSETAGA